MACVLKFVRLNDFIADIDEIDLMAGGYELAKDGYLPTAAPDGVKSVFESITLKITGTSKDDLASKVQEIDEKIKQIGWWISDPSVERYQVWLRAQLSNESLPRQAQILNIKPPERIPLYNPLEIGANYIGEYTLGIERTPFWEDSYPYPSTSKLTSVSVVGGVEQLNETINGVDPARLAEFILEHPNPSVERMTDFWVGFMTSRLKNPANFQPVWSLSDAPGGSFSPPDTTGVADGDTVSGTRMEVAFTSTSALSTRIYLSVADALTTPANHADQRGTYTVLLRARVSSDTTTCMVRMLYGFGGVAAGYNPVYRGILPITTGSSDGYNLYELGKLSIPTFRTRTNANLSNFTIGLQAARVSVAGSLYLDCLILIPADEGAAKIKAGIGTVSNMYIIARNAANGETSGEYFDSSISTILAPVIVRPDRHFDLPANNEKPYVVIAACSKDLTAFNSCQLSGILNLEYTYITRFRTLRGNVT